jgi:hypothetical protein
MLKQKKRVKPLNVEELEDYVLNRNRHYMFYTNATIARVMEATEEEKE